MNQKTLIILVIVLVVLFVVGTGAGIIKKSGDGTNAQGTPEAFNLDVSWIQTIGDIFSPRIGSEDIDWAATVVGTPPPCPTTAFAKTTPSFTLNEATGCRFIFRSSGTRSRTLKLELDTAGNPAVDLTYIPVTSTGTPDSSDFAYGATLYPTRPAISVSVRQFGGTLTIFCTSGANGSNQCLFRLNP